VRVITIIDNDLITIIDAWFRRGSIVPFPIRGWGTERFSPTWAASRGQLSVAANEGANVWPEWAKGAMNGSRPRLGRSVVQTCLGGAAPKPPEFIA
jgi:hypothetical protein